MKLWEMFKNIKTDVNFTSKHFFLYVAQFVRKIEFLIFNKIFHDLNKIRALKNKKIVVKNSEKLNCSYGKVSHDPKGAVITKFKILTFHLN